MTTIDSVNEAIRGQKFDDAVKLASEILDQVPTSVPLLLARSTAYARLGESSKALSDAEHAVVYSDSQQMANSQLRRAIALFQAKEFGKAKKAISYALAKKPKNLSKPEEMQFAMWQTKINSQEATSGDLVEIPSITAPAAKLASSSGLNQGASQSGTEGDVNTAKHVNTSAENVSPHAAVVETRKGWYQSSSNVNVSVFAKNTPKDADIKIEDTSIIINYPGFEFKLDLNQTVIPGESTYEASSVKVEFNLRKAQPGQWPKLERDQDAPLPVSVPAPSQSIQPSNLSQTTQPQGQPVVTTQNKWDNLDVSDEEEDSSDPNAFFKSIYEKADADTQRAMMKSFVESNGTTLSTNWEEVSKGRVEPAPPSK